ncbi:MAG: helix-turn-helix domain-containing protein [Labilithrix sp.]|nr:helix-turn-helix domain-containing protein [Labilithrix sp.]MCW5818217.1 helix-turn-helix domain-containing protein [Labilithrix sp.]
MKRCECGGDLKAGPQRLSAVAGGRRFRATVTAPVCRRCRASFVDGRLLERFDLAIACDLAMRGPADGETFRFLRKAIGLAAATLAELLGVSAETISRWENGQRAVDGPAWITVGTLVLERAGRPTSTLDRLGVLARDARPASPVTLVVQPQAATKM